MLAMSAEVDNSRTLLLRKGGRGSGSGRSRSSSSRSRTLVDALVSHCRLAELFDGVAAAEAREVGTAENRVARAVIATWFPILLPAFVNE